MSIQVSGKVAKKTGYPDIGVASKAMPFIISFVNDILERITGESSRLA